jgi:hypothetical protein
MNLAFGTPGWRAFLHPDMAQACGDRDFHLDDAHTDDGHVTVTLDSVNAEGERLERDEPYVSGWPDRSIWRTTAPLPAEQPTTIDEILSGFDFRRLHLRFQAKNGSRQSIHPASNRKGNRPSGVPVTAASISRRQKRCIRGRADLVSVPTTDEAGRAKTQCAAELETSA